MEVDDENAGDDLTDDHRRVLQWLDVHPFGTSPDAMAKALDLDPERVEALCNELVAAGMIEPLLLH